MVKCKLCGKEYKNRRGLNAHLLKAHIDEYRQSGCKLDQFCTGVQNVNDDVQIRPLNLEDEAEQRAYESGYRFTDGDNLYTDDDMRKAV